MCNVYNSGGYGRMGCLYGNGTGVTNTGNGGYACGCWNGYYQRMCRDLCGNIVVRNTGCGCQRQCCGCPCYHGCGGNNVGTGNNGVTGNNGNGGTNGNGVFRCVTFCGYGNGLGNNTQNTGTNGTATCGCGNAYYARQYGLTCDDNADCVYNFNTQ